MTEQTVATHIWRLNCFAQPIKKLTCTVYHDLRVFLAVLKVETKRKSNQETSERINLTFNFRKDVYAGRSGEKFLSRY